MHPNHANVTILRICPGYHALLIWYASIIGYALHHTWAIPDSVARVAMNP